MRGSFWGVLVKPLPVMNPKKQGRITRPLLVDGQATGLIKAEIMNWSGKFVHDAQRRPPRRPGDNRPSARAAPRP